LLKADISSDWADFSSNLPQTMPDFRTA